MSACNSTEIRGLTLHEAAWRGDISAVKSCLEAGAKIEATDNYGKTPLHYVPEGLFCVFGENYTKQLRETLNLLLDNGANPNVEDKYKSTPLHCAAREGNEAMVKLLLEKGADPHSVDLEQVSNPEIKKMLLDYRLQKDNELDLQDWEIVQDECLKNGSFYVLQT